MVLVPIYYNLQILLMMEVQKSPWGSFQDPFYNKSQVIFWAAEPHISLL